MQNILRDPIARWSALLIAGIGLFWFSGLDAIIAVTVADVSAGWAWEMRQWSIYPAILMSLVFILFLLIPWVRKPLPVIRKIAIVWLFALIIGGGLVNQVLVKEVVDRPRPRQTVLLEESAQQVGGAHIDGNSFPSGHAVIGFIFMVPGLVLWRRQRKLALVFLAGGLIAGGVVGYGRMALGAHYVSDIFGSLFFTLIPAALLNRYWPTERDLPTWFSGGFIALAIGLLIGFNDFRLTLKWDPAVFPQRVLLALPCDSFEVGRGETLAVRVQLEGYGAPISNLQLVAHEEFLTLSRWKGAFHSINCEAQIALPTGVSLAIPADRELFSNGEPPQVVGPLNKWLTVQY